MIIISILVCSWGGLIMKYKIRPFKYGPYDYRDAEHLLNEMSQKGWQFKTTSKGWLRNWGMFEKTKDENKPIYNIDLKGSMMESEKDEYCRLYDDLGWHYLDTYNKKLNIFKSDRKNNIPIYSDEQAEYDNLKEYGKISTDIGAIMLFLFTAALMYLSFCMLGRERYILVSYGMFVALTMCLVDSMVIIALNTMYRSNCKHRMKQTGQLPKNLLLKKWRVWQFYGENLLILLMGFVPILGFGYEIWGKGLIPKNQLLLCGKEIYFFMALIGFVGMFVINYIYMTKPDKRFLRIIDFMFDFSWLFAFGMYLQCLG